MNEIEDDFSYCDCECECQDCENGKCGCDCNCDCTTINGALFITRGQLAKIKTRIPGIRFTLPSKAGSKSIPTDRPIRVRIPRDQICNSIPDGALRWELCEPERLNLNTVSNGKINVCILVFPGAKVGNVPISSNIPERVKNEMNAANQIWQKRDNGKTIGIQFKIVNCSFFNKMALGIGRKTESFPWNQKEIEDILYKHGRQICPQAHVFVYYMDGDSIGPVYSDGTRTDAITFRNDPVIMMSNGAQKNKYILAHELGHFMYTNNLLNYKFDPDPYVGDPDHNTDPTNLMYPKSDYWPSHPQKPEITPAQLRKALNTRFFYN